jgi:WD40 repeat protein
MEQAYNITDIQYSKPFKLVAISDESGTLIINKYSPKHSALSIQNIEVYRYRGHKACITKIAWADCENGCALATSSIDKTVVLHSKLNTGDWISSTPFMLDSFVLGIDFTPKEYGFIIGAITYYGTIYLITSNVSSSMRELKSKCRYESQVKLNSPISAIAFRPFSENYPDQKMQVAYTGGDDRTLMLMCPKYKEGKPICDNMSKDDDITKVVCLDWCPVCNEQYILAVGTEKAVKVCFFDIKTDTKSCIETVVDYSVKKLKWESTILILLKDDKILQYEADIVNKKMILIE